MKLRSADGEKKYKADFNITFVEVIYKQRICFKTYCKFSAYGIE